ncbi:hypothetical protein C8F04DRAFT_1177468 [Mycena alexandri]|uniref:Uncharacterized protein n=1 Tax=Mycena alexandri TaxID=1745969 RepID=A0AAD6T6R2_9AGAR|nr:hypothetical protein C8F04DRAFT_1177468 [Mycena alexandri]
MTRLKVWVPSLGVSERRRDDEGAGEKPIRGSAGSGPTKARAKQSQAFPSFFPSPTSLMDTALSSQPDDEAQRLRPRHGPVGYPEARLSCQPQFLGSTLIKTRWCIWQCYVFTRWIFYSKQVVFSVIYRLTNGHAGTPPSAVVKRICAARL